MSAEEHDLIQMIRSSADPSQALLTAVTVICDYLKQHESSAKQAAADLQEPV